MPPKAVFDVAKAAALHASGLSLAAVARQPGMPCAKTLETHLREMGYEVWKGRRKLDGVSKDRLYDLHHAQDLSASAIGEIFNCSGSAVRRKLVELGIPKGAGNHRSATGPLHWSWKGGRHVDARGYVRVRCPGHPNASKSGYVLEHRKVASDAIGRALLAAEEVHHIDGDKTNNSPSNLIVVPSGKHQRLHADVMRELQALRQEVMRLTERSAAVQASSVPNSSNPQTVNWKVIG
jgi:hypothetical protein